ncbi:MAG: putative toxin-antitoxin system toxin component, PIN family [Bifidobacteriaceae bacterium]|jgi:putative PIN family toxin of toxin-antitoxin system|nr:putative toxin-antitoxin system toxin component, PIN family [Bifidobacteriaceae bacterium]
MIRSAPLRAVLDTNVLVLGLLNSVGPPGQVLAHLASRRFVALFDGRVLAEYQRALARERFGFAAQDAAELIAKLIQFGWAVTPTGWPEEMTDESDRMLVEAAVSADAWLVTGNARHSQKGDWVVTPARFAALLTTEIQTRPR